MIADCLSWICGRRATIAGLIALFLGGAPCFAQGIGYSLRYFGNGDGDIDRVKIRIDAPEVPADIGAGDFTLEFWMKANSGENRAQGCRNGADNWITGNIIIDRDINGAGDLGDYGISLCGRQRPRGLMGAGKFDSSALAAPSSGVPENLSR
jgi:hypothetical protein